MKLGQFERIDLQPLSAEETSALLATVLGGPVAPHAARGLWTLTQGNALYLQNIVEHEITEGRLVRQHGVWQWTGDPVVPPGLVELIESRIGDLPTSVGDVVDALAVGEPIGLAALQRITAATAVEDADTRGLITSNRSPAAWRSASRIRSTERFGADARLPPGCGVYAAW